MIDGAAPFFHSVASLDATLSTWLDYIDARFPVGILNMANAFQDNIPDAWDHIFLGSEGDQSSMGSPRAAPSRRNRPPLSTVTGPANVPGLITSSPRWRVTMIVRAAATRPSSVPFAPFPASRWIQVSIGRSVSVSPAKAASASVETVHAPCSTCPRETLTLSTPLGHI